MVLFEWNSMFQLCFIYAYWLPLKGFALKASIDKGILKLSKNHLSDAECHIPRIAILIYKLEQVSTLLSQINLFFRAKNKPPTSCVSWPHGLKSHSPFISCPCRE